MSAAPAAADARSASSRIAQDHRRIACNRASGAGHIGPDKIGDGSAYAHPFLLRCKSHRKSCDSLENFAMPERPPKPPAPTDRPLSPRFKQRGKKNNPSERTLTDLIRVHPSPEESDKAWNEIRSGTARAAAIVSDAFVQDTLVFALTQRFLIRPPLTLERLLDPPGVLSSFYSAIDLGLALGLYGPVFYEDLHTVRRIRNGFAHVMVSIDFDTPEVAREVAQLKYLTRVKAAPKRPISEYRTPGITDFIAHGAIPTESNREKYTVTCQLLTQLIGLWSNDYDTRPRESHLP